MTKAQALLNFQAVTSYLIWKYSNTLYTTISQDNKYLECHMHFDPDELAEDSLRNEINEIRDANTQMDFRNVRGYTTRVVEIEWEYI